MKITQDTVVTMHYKVVNAQGQVLDKAQQPTSYLHGGYDNTLPKIEEALEGQEVGFAITLNLAAADAFGERDESLVQTIPKTEFPPGVKVGGQLRGLTPDGRDQVFNVVKIKGDKVILDGNHPWAGLNLSMTLKVLDVRAASADEVTHRHAHGDHGHHH
ncbi:peptidylprolyl isomerase [Limnohabitans sp.]|uniref:peptidylprolyl isomerase n=1 Tax=Limnohabitans sp. TaxID=1907725 RepID=UPI0037C1851C